MWPPDVAKNQKCALSRKGVKCKMNAKAAIPGVVTDSESVFTAAELATTQPALQLVFS